MTSWMLYVHRYTWNIIRPELQREYGLSNTALESIFSAFNFSYAFFQIPSGIICDLFGAHLFLGLIILVWSLALPTLGLSGNLYMLGGSRLLFGAAQAGAYPSLGQVTKTWFPRSSRTLIQGLVASLFGRGGGAMAPIILATVLMGYFGLSWRIALLFMSAVGVALAIVFLLFYRNRPDEDPRVNEQELEIIHEGEVPDGGPGRMLPFRQALKNNSLRVLVVQQFMNAGADIIYTSMMGSYFLSKGISMGKAGLLVSLPMWGGAAGGVFGGFLNDRLVRTIGPRWGRTVVGMTGKLIAVAMLVLAVMQTEPVTIAIALFVVKFFSDWTQPTVWGACSDLGKRFAATLFSINNTAGNVGALLIPLAVGPLLDWYTTVTMVPREVPIMDFIPLVNPAMDLQTTVTVGQEALRVTNYTPMFVVVGVMYVLSALCWLGIDCTRPVPQELPPTEPSSS